MSLVAFALRGLAVWRLSHMLVDEPGPGRVFRRLREASGIEYDKYDMPSSYNDYTPLYCVLCTSVYVAGVSLVFPRWLLTLLALSGFAILIDKGCGDGPS